jgi:hypothetical protein
MPLLTSCGAGARPNSVTDRPPLERVAPPAPTSIPDGEVTCADNPQQRCLSDRQNAELLRSYENGERARDRQLCWLLVWFGYPACTTD